AQQRAGAHHLISVMIYSWNLPRKDDSPRKFFGELNRSQISRSLTKLLAYLLPGGSVPPLLLDFRLNPAVKSESDSRLFVVRMRPGIGCAGARLGRGLVLDDRPVREGRAVSVPAAFYFDEESMASKQSFPAVFSVERPRHSRAKCTARSTKKCSVMDADDEAVLNLIAKCKRDLSKPPGSASSSWKEAPKNRSPCRVLRQYSTSVGTPGGRAPEKKRSVRACEGRLCRAGAAGQRVGERPPLPPRQHFAPPSASTDLEDAVPSLESNSLTQKVLHPLPTTKKVQEVKDARREVPGAFRPVVSELPEGGSEPQEWFRGLERGALAHGGARWSVRAEASPWCVPTCTRLRRLPVKKAALEVRLLAALLNLMGRYWSGCRPLHSDEVFLTQARHDCSTVVNEEIRYLTLEKKSLHSHLAELQQQYGVIMSEVV
ncbi:hypothetical protein EI555_020622, partial [Monodon monoceros]